MINKDEILRLGRHLQIEIKDFELEEYWQKLNESLGRVEEIVSLKPDGQDIWLNPASRTLQTRPDQTDSPSTQEKMVDGSLTKSNDYFTIP